ncbi:MAG: signal recognition particle-docking protein FtsY [Pseudomonadales bacterium]|nr:signal recognition particle-docking protein FtsY [Pseudomonadales bacterium]
MGEDTSESGVTDKDDNEKVGIWSRMRKGLAKTRVQLAEGVGNLLLGEREINDEVLEDLETALLLTDVGFATTEAIMTDLAGQVARQELNNTTALYASLKTLLVQRLEPLQRRLEISHQPHVIFFVGVNGVGKTTTIGKLAKRFQAEGKSVLLAAGDTFRAAAVGQLKAWGERNDVPVIAQGQGSDSASVVFDAYESARSRHADVLLVDTAGRLQAKTQLMDELKKIHRVIKRLDAEAPHDVILVLDGGVGQNALSQVALFDEAVDLTGLVITKLDGSAKAGVLFAIAAMSDINIPVHFIGVGESIDDLRDFEADVFVDALLKPGDD